MRVFGPIIENPRFMVKLKIRGNFEYNANKVYAIGSTCSLFRAWRTDERSSDPGYILKRLNSKTHFQEFVREWTLISRLQSPYVVKLYDFFQKNLKTYILMEFIDGMTLGQLLSHRDLEDLEKKFILFELWNALQYIHGEDVCHGDLAPQNVMIDKKGQLKLIDFGVTESLQRGTSGFVGPLKKNFGVLSRESDQESFFLLASWVLNRSIGHEQMQRIVHEFSKRKHEEIVSYRRDLGQKIDRLKSVPRTEALPEIRADGPKERAFAGRFFGFRKIGPAIVLILLPLFTKSFDRTNNTLSFGMTHVKIRTKSWIRVAINGKDYGYSPLDLRLRPGRHQMKWTSLYQKGELILTIRGQKNRIIRDQHLFREKK